MFSDPAIALARLDYYVPYHSRIGGLLTEDNSLLGGIGNDTPVLIKQHTLTPHHMPGALCVRTFLTLEGLLLLFNNIDYNTQNVRII